MFYREKVLEMIKYKNIIEAFVQHSEPDVFFPKSDNFQTRTCLFKLSRSSLFKRKKSRKMKALSVVFSVVVAFLFISSATSSCSTSILDLIIILDASGSIGPADFNLAVQAAEDIVSKLNVGPNTVRVGYFTYDNTVRPITTLVSTDQDKAKLIQLIQNTVYTGGATATGDALEFAARIFNSYPRAQAPKIVTLFTDGASNTGRPVVAEATKLKDLQVDIFAIGIGTGINQQELEDVASIPTSKYKKLITDYASLFNEVNAITNVACETPAFITVKEPVQIKAVANETRNFQVDMTKLPIRSSAFFVIALEIIEGNALLTPSYDGETALAYTSAETIEIDGRIIFNYYYPIDKSQARFYVKTKALDSGNNEYNFNVDVF